MPDPAARLCAACGLCCNGVLFFSARLDPADPARRLAALGLRIKRRADGLHLLQPCPAHTGTQCRVYADRPTRCRVFVCRQLRGLEEGTIPEAAAHAAVARTRRLADRVGALLEQIGDARTHKALSTRCETALTPPLNPDHAAQREELVSAWRELEDALVRDFRVGDSPGPP